MENREAYIILNGLSGIGPIRVAQMLSVLGEARCIFTASRANLVRIPGIGETLASLILNWPEHFDLGAELELTARAGVRILTREDEEYPALLREIHDPPICLYVRGEPGVLQRARPAVAVVGSRHTTPYGVSVAETLSVAAAVAGWTVVSGLARGIDTVAHQAVLRTKGCTIALLGSGLGRIYPQDNVELARMIARDGGALASEFPMLFPPDKRGFPMRNRLISGMTLGTIVVEAGTQSGALITATQALDQGRQVFAVPGRIDSPQSRGCHALIRDGAKLVESFADVLDEFAALPIVARQRSVTSPATSAAQPAAAPARPLLLSDVERKVVELVQERGEIPIDDLIADAGEPANRVLSALVSLEIRHIVSQLPGKRVVMRTAQG